MAIIRITKSGATRLRCEISASSGDDYPDSEIQAIADMVFAESELNFDADRLPVAQHFVRLFKELKNTEPLVCEIYAYKCSFSGFSWPQIILKEARFLYCNLDETLYARVNAVKFEITGCDLRGADFDRLEALRARVRTSRPDEHTRFHGMTRPSTFSIDRETFQRLGERNGGLDGDELSKVNLIDDLATFRSEFIGLHRLSHLLAIGVFLVPYVVFLLRLWFYSLIERGSSANSLTVFEALARYVWNGGIGWQGAWQFHWWSFGMFVYMALYNVLRVVLIRKVNALETRERAFGVPARFRFDDRICSLWFEDLYWGDLFRLVKLGGYLAWGVALLNAARFMSMEVSIPPM